MQEEIGIVKKDEEIDLLNILKNIWNCRITIYKVTAIFFLIGLLIAFGTPKEYKSEITLLIENESIQSSMSGLLQQFGGIAGINMNSGEDGDVMKPELYPQIIKSTPFLLEVMNQKVTESKYDSTLSVSDYLDRHTKSSVIGIIKSYTIGLPGKIIGIIKRKKSYIVENNKISGLFVISKKQVDISKALASCIKIKNGEINGTLCISVQVQDPIVAAQLTDSVVKSLTKYVIDYRTQKAKNYLQFILDRYNEAESKFIHKQQNLALYKDQNKNIISATVNTEGERLQTEYNLAFNMYNNLSQQLEQAKIKVQEKTPLFKVIEPAQVPLQKCKPQTTFIIMSFIILGAFLGIVFIALKNIMQSFYEI